jgi:hypothetical protein
MKSITIHGIDDPLAEFDENTKDFNKVDQEDWK